MNIYVMVDLEGISGVMSSEQVMSGRLYYNEGRRYMTSDINACIEGCLQAGVEKIIVRDAHATGKNVIWEELSPAAEYVIGKVANERMPGIEECDGVILLGYHAMAGTPGAILEHTMSSGSWQKFWMNGQLMGEVGIDAAIAGDYGKPVIMVSGDDKVCIEAKVLLPDVVTTQVKVGLSVFGGRLLSRDAAHELICKKTIEAVQKLKSMSPFQVQKPVTMRLERVERSILPFEEEKPYMKRIDGRTIEVYGNSVNEALRRLMI